MNPLDKYFKNQLSSKQYPLKDEYVMDMEKLLDRQARKRRGMFWLIPLLLVAVASGLYLFLPGSHADQPNNDQEQQTEKLHAFQSEVEEVVPMTSGNEKNSSEISLETSREVSGIDDVTLTEADSKKTQSEILIEKSRFDTQVESLMTINRKQTEQSQNLAQGLDPEIVDPNKTIADIQNDNVDHPASKTKQASGTQDISPEESSGKTQLTKSEVIAESKLKNEIHRIEDSTTEEKNPTITQDFTPEESVKHQYSALAQDITPVKTSDTNEFDAPAYERKSFNVMSGLPAMALAWSTPERTWSQFSSIKLPNMKRRNWGLGFGITSIVRRSSSIPGDRNGSALGAHAFFNTKLYRQFRLQSELGFLYLDGGYAYEKSSTVTTFGFGVRRDFNTLELQKTWHLSWDNLLVYQMQKHQIGLGAGFQYVMTGKGQVTIDTEGQLEQISHTKLENASVSLVHVTRWPVDLIGQYAFQISDKTSLGIALRYHVISLTRISHKVGYGFYRRENPLSPAISINYHIINPSR